MAQRWHRFEFLSPADTPPINSTTEAVTFPPGVVLAFIIEIPSGHHNLTGIRIFYGENQIIPLGGTAYIRGDKKKVPFDLDDPYPGGSGWFVEHFNSDHFYDHTFYVNVGVDAQAVLSGGDLPPILLLRVSGEGGPVPSGAPALTSGAGGGPVPTEEWPLSVSARGTRTVKCGRCRTGPLCFRERGSRSRPEERTSPASRASSR